LKEKIVNFFKSAYTYLVLMGMVFSIIVCFLIFKQKKAYELIELLNGRLKAREQELEGLKKIEAERKKKQEEIEAKFQLMLKELEEKHKIELSQITEAKKEELRNLLIKYNNDPEAQAEHLNELFGLSSTS